MNEYNTYKFAQKRVEDLFDAMNKNTKWYSDRYPHLKDLIISQDVPSLLKIPEGERFLKVQSSIVELRNYWIDKRKQLKQRNNE